MRVCRRTCNSSILWWLNTRGVLSKSFSKGFLCFAGGLIGLKGHCHTGRFPEDPHFEVARRADENCVNGFNISTYGIIPFVEPVLIRATVPPIISRL